MDKKLQFRKVVEQIKKENSKPVEDLSLLVKEDSERQDKEISQLKEKQEQIEKALQSKLSGSGGKSSFKKRPMAGKTSETVRKLQSQLDAVDEEIKNHQKESKKQDKLNKKAGIEEDDNETVRGYKTAALNEDKTPEDYYAERRDKGEGRLKSAGGAVSDKFKNYMTGLKEEWNPLSLAKQFAGKKASKKLGKYLGKDESEIRHFTETDKEKEQRTAEKATRLKKPKRDSVESETLTPSPINPIVPEKALTPEVIPPATSTSTASATKLESAKEPGSLTDILSDIYGFMSKNREEDIDDRQKLQSKVEEDGLKKEVRHKEFLDALKGLSGLQGEATAKPAEDSGSGGGGGITDLLGKFKGKGAKGAGKTAEKLGATAGKEAAEAAGKTAGKVAEKGVIKKAVVKALGSVGKSLLKKIPLIGIGAGLWFAAERAMDGDFKGAAAEAASGVAGTIPGVGTVASVGLDIGLMARDVYKSVYGVFPDDDDPKARGARLDDITSTIKEFASPGDTATKADGESASGAAGASSSGAAGGSGAAGAAGGSVASASSGAAGGSGAAGAAGGSGAAGAAGGSGGSGVAGGSGASASPGAAGGSGAAGAAGAAGGSGAAASPGAAGGSGAAGAAGAAGGSGAPGATPSPATPAAAGASGTPGAPGAVASPATPGAAGGSGAPGASAAPAAATPMSPASPTASSAPAPPPAMGNALVETTQQNQDMKLDAVATSGGTTVNNNTSQESGGSTEIDTTKEPMPPIRNKEPTFERLVYYSTRVV